MTHRRTAITAAGFTALVMALALFPPDQADAASVDKDTHMTFAYAVRVPDATLPAGRYVFLLDQNERAVWIISEADQQVYGPYLTLRRYRTGSTKRVVLLDNTVEWGGVPAIRAWFGPHERVGHEFIYRR